MKPPAGPRPVTAAYLRKAALHYLSGRSASAAMVRQTLERRAKRRLIITRLEPEIVALIDAAVAELVHLQLIDDTKFTEIRGGTLARKGLARQRIAQSLRAKGVAADLIAAAQSTDVDDLAQARRLIERKRLGPHRRGGATPETRDKDLRTLARAGFSYQIAARALKTTGDDE